MIPVVAEDPAGPAALPTPDSWQWFTETGRTPGAVLEERGHAALGRDVHRVRARRLHRLRQPDAAADGGGAGRPSDGRRRGARRLRAGARAEEARDPKGGHFDAYVADFEAASAAARDWFVEHLSG